MTLAIAVGAAAVVYTAFCCCAENGFMGMGIGAAMTGLRPIVEGMNMGFLLLAYNQISNNAGMLHYTSGGQFKACVSTTCHLLKHVIQLFLISSCNCRAYFITFIFKQSISGKITFLVKVSARIAPMG